LTPETIEAVLGDFRAWLHQIAAAPTGPDGDSRGAEADVLDLHTLLGQFVALRHEVHLQTRATRAQQEQNAESLRQLSQALEMLRQTADSGEQPAQQEQEEQLRPLLKTLVDVYDALSLAAREVQRVRDKVLLSLEDFTTLSTEPPRLLEPAVSPKPGFWSRWFNKSLAREAEQPRPQQQHLTEQERHRKAAQAAEGVRQVLDSILTGYTMSLQRLERTSQQQRLEIIPCTGEPFDPELMEVVEVVTGSDRPAGEVVEEVRRGYLWRGRVFRYAQVRVAKS